MKPILDPDLQTKMKPSRDALDAWTREIVQWHFNPETGCPFWLEYAQKLAWDPRQEIQGYEDLARFGPFQDEWLRGGPVRRWVPKAYADKPVYVFETDHMRRHQIERIFAASHELKRKLDRLERMAARAQHADLVFDEAVEIKRHR